MDRDRDDLLLARTLELARGGIGRVDPNPLVGAVLVKSSEVVATGFHRQYGGLHAEAEALYRAGPRARGGTLYCNLEPCAFSSPQKHQPPCAEAIVAAGVKRVVIGQIDPNPKMRGAGVAYLERAGVEVSVLPEGPLLERIWRCNKLFNTTMALHRPLVHLKSAISLDGRIAAAGGDSRWITDERARRHAHRVRSGFDAVLIGRGTAETDDPLLTVRLGRSGGAARRGRQPRAVVLDRTARLPLDGRLVRERAHQLMVVTTDAASEEARLGLSDRGVTVITLPDTAPGTVLAALWQVGIRSVLVEGGATITTAFLRSGLWDLYSFYIAPLILGEGISAVGDLAIAEIPGALRLEAPQWRRIGDQQLLSGYRPGWYEDVHRTH